MSTGRSRDVIFFVALLSTALAMGAALAHALELPNKIGLPEQPYFAVQQIYRGWELLAALLLIELASMGALAASTRKTARAFRLVVGAIASLVAAQCIFWAFTFPANQATANWTKVPAGWQALRLQWEYSHAVGAAFQILAMSLLIGAALARERG